MTDSTPNRPTTGLDLKLARIARRVKLVTLAESMGLDHSTLSKLEARAIVSDEQARRYREALATFPDVATGTAA